MRRSATVVTVEEQSVTLSCPTQACTACSASYCGPRTHLVRARNAAGIELNPRDHVEYEISSSRAVRAAIVIFSVLPLLFIAGFFVVRLVLPGAAESLSAAFGFVFLLTGVGLWYRSTPPASQEELPSIVRKLPADGSSTAS